MGPFTQNDLIESAVEAIEKCLMFAIRLAWIQAGKAGVQAMLVGLQTMLDEYKRQVDA